MNEVDIQSNHRIQKKPETSADEIVESIIMDRDDYEFDIKTWIKCEADCQNEDLDVLRCSDCKGIYHNRYECQLFVVNKYGHNVCQDCFNLQAFDPTQNIEDCILLWSLS
jgi:hypothetical protein